MVRMLPKVWKANLPYSEQDVTARDVCCSLPYLVVVSTCLSNGTTHADEPNTVINVIVH